MKILSYIKYFSYICFNWNLPIAFRIIRSEIKGEKKYGINTTGADELKALDKKGIDISHATIYMPVSYEMIETVFEQINQLTNQPINHFLDIGCGKGRAMCVAAYQGCKKITGIDFSKELCEAAEQNCDRTKKRFPDVSFRVINNDAFYFDIPTDADVIFLFNPFDEVIMSAVVKNILKNIKTRSRRVIVAYVNPVHKELFINAGFKENYHSKEMKYLELSVLTPPTPSAP